MFVVVSSVLVLCFYPLAELIETIVRIRTAGAKFYFLLKHWNVLTIKRKFYYIFSLLFFLPLFYALKDRLILLLAKIKNNIK